LATEKPKVTVISTIESPSNNPARTGKNDYYITYQIDPLHRYTLVLPAETFTEAILDLAVRQDYKKRQPFINREITVG